MIAHEEFFDGADKENDIGVEMTLSVEDFRPSYSSMLITDKSNPVPA
jgi:hypothetical protein